MSTEKINANTMIKDDSTIEISPIPFKSFASFLEIDSDELANKISSIFRPIFHDFVGSFITYTGKRPNGTDCYEVTLFFEPNPNEMEKGKISNIVNLTSTNSSNRKSIFEQNAVIQNRLNNKIYTLDDETKILLAPFMYGGKDANKPNAKSWNTNVKQKVYHSNNPFVKNYNAEHIVLEVTGLDLNVIVQKLYGETMITHSSITADNKVKSYTAKARYNTRFMHFLNGSTGKLFTVHIEQYDEDEVSKITMKNNPQFIQQYGYLAY